MKSRILFRFISGESISGKRLLQGGSDMDPVMGPVVRTESGLDKQTGGFGANAGDHDVRSHEEDAVQHLEEKFGGGGIQQRGLREIDEH